MIDDEYLNLWYILAENGTGRHVITDALWEWRYSQQQGLTPFESTQPDCLPAYTVKSKTLV